MYKFNRCLVFTFVMLLASCGVAFAQITSDMVLPTPNNISSCTDQPILIQISSVTPIDPASIILSINGTLYTTDSAEIIYNAASQRLEFNASGRAVFTDGLQTVTLVAIADSAGVVGTPHTWNFLVDLTSPIITSTTPAATSTITDLDFTLGFTIVDGGTIASAISGLAESSVIVNIINNSGTHDVTAYLTHTGSAFSIPMSATGLSFRDNETFTVHVTAHDNIAESTYCGANRLDTTWTLRIGETTCQKSSNPITPGEIDGYNDFVEFGFPNMRDASQDRKIFIYDRGNRLVREIDAPTSGKWIWNGTDENDKIVTQGVYVYIIQVGSENVCNGTISVAR